MGYLSRIRYAIWTPFPLLQDRITGEVFYTTPWPRRVANAVWRALVKGKWIFVAFVGAIIAALGAGVGNQIFAELSKPSVQEAPVDSQKADQSP